MKVLSFYNIKGGVGKTTFAVNTAFEAARTGLKTLLWDLDPQASASYILRIAPKFKGEIRRVGEKNPRLSKSIKETDWPLLDILPGDFELRTLSQSLQERKRQANRLTDGQIPVSELASKHLIAHLSEHLGQLRALEEMIPENT